MASQQDGKQQWGTTAPLSTAQPTTRDLELNDSLLAYLKAENNFESADETDKRRIALEKMQEVTEEFVRHVGRVKGLPQSVIDNAGGKIVTFGSYRLGVYGPGSDIDSLLVAPKHVSRADWFEHFPRILEKMSPAGAIEEMTPVPGAFTPIIKLHYSGIDIDLIFVRLATVASVPKDFDLSSSSILRGLDDADMRSISGPRQTDEMLSLVPQTKTFRLALRAIKLWASRRGVYGNLVGFPGGIAWAIMVARICQLYPFACSAVIVVKFFHLFMKWQFPRPVLLKDIEDGPLQVKVWNPVIYRGDQQHIMPIITPAYPSMCSTHNINYSTKEIISRELKRADQIMEQLSKGEKTWKDLFMKQKFFSEGYKSYLAIVSGSRTKEAQQIWSGAVGAKVRHLVKKLDEMKAENPNFDVDLAQPYHKGFERVHRCKTEEEVNAVLQGSMDYQVEDIKTETTDGGKDIKQAAAAQGGGDGIEMPTATGAEVGEDGARTIYTTTFYLGLGLREKGTKSLDITYAVATFKKMCVDMDIFNPELNSIRTVHTRNYDLPADVFGPDETKPQRPKKKSAKPTAAAVNKKRSFAESGIQEAVNGAKRPTNGTAVAG